MFASARVLLHSDSAMSETARPEASPETAVLGDALNLVFNEAGAEPAPASFLSMPALTNARPGTAATLQPVPNNGRSLGIRSPLPQRYRARNH